MKKLAYLFSLFLFLCGCASTYENIFEQDIDAFDNIPHSSLLQGTYTARFATPAMLEKGNQSLAPIPGGMVTEEDRKFSKVAVFPAKGIIVWIDKDGKKRRLNVTQGYSHMIHEYGQTILWLGDSSERGFYLLDFDPSSDGTQYKGRLLKGDPTQVPLGIQ